MRSPKVLFDQPFWCFSGKSTTLLHSLLTFCCVLLENRQKVRLKSNYANQKIYSNKSPVPKCHSPPIKYTKKYSFKIKYFATFFIDKNVKLCYNNLNSPLAEKISPIFRFNLTNNLLKNGQFLPRNVRGRILPAITINMLKI